MPKKWIVVVDREKVRFFQEKPFRLLHTLENEIGRLKNREMTTDKPGMARSKLSSPSATHTMGPEKNPHEDAAIQFAKTVGRYIEKKEYEHQFDDIAIAAEPKMMGRIRSELDKKLSDRVEWVSKDLAHLADHEIAETFGINLRVTS